jgi:hypothetical protein
MWAYFGRAVHRYFLALVLRVPEQFQAALNDPADEKRNLSHNVVGQGPVRILILIAVRFIFRRLWSPRLGQRRSSGSLAPLVNSVDGSAG